MIEEKMITSHERNPLGRQRFPCGDLGYAMNSEPATIVAYILSLIDKREVMPLKEHN